MKKIKIIISLSLVALSLVSNPISANAEWKKDDKGWWNSEVTGLTYLKWCDIWKEKYGSDTIKANTTSYKAIEDLPLDYSFNLAKENGDVVCSLMEQYNVQKLDNFFEIIIIKQQICILGIYTSIYKSN